MRIYVSSTDIEEASRSHPTCCPLGLALRKATGKQWWVDRTTAKFWDGDQFQECAIPHLCIKRLERWRWGERVGPFHIELELRGKNLLREFVTL